MTYHIFIFDFLFLVLRITPAENHPRGISGGTKEGFHDYLLRALRADFIQGICLTDCLSSLLSPSEHPTERDLWGASVPKK